jgi:hypothetical protein
MSYLVSVCIYNLGNISKPWGYHLVDWEWSFTLLFEKIITGIITGEWSAGDGFTDVGMLGYDRVKKC